MVSVPAQFLHVAEDVHLVVCVQFLQHRVCSTEQPASCGTVPAWGTNGALNLFRAYVKNKFISGSKTKIIIKGRVKYPDPFPPSLFSLQEIKNLATFPIEVHTIFFRLSAAPPFCQFLPHSHPFWILNAITDYISSHVHIPEHAVFYIITCNSTGILNCGIKYGTVY